MSELLRVQRALQDYLLASSKSLAKIDSSGGINLNALIAETERVPRSIRLHIYANAYRARMIEALSTDFSGLHAYLGDDEFSELVDAYIEKHTSSYFSLRNVGSELGDFLQSTQPYATHIELSELAAFEWALCHAFDASDTAIADAAYFSALPPQQWPQLTLRFAPAVKQLAMRSNAVAIWTALSAEKTPPALRMESAEQHWLVWRRGLKILFRPLDAIEKIAFDLFANGKTFVDVCETFVELMPESEVPLRANRILQQWLVDELIAAS